MSGRAPNWLSSTLAALLLLPGVARADIAGKLSSYEQEARAIGTDLPRPNTITGAGERRLVDAQVAFALGDYDNAALTLFDLASKPGAEQETALYYLAESLFQKGEKGAARTYYAQVAALGNASGRYREPSLLRMVEIAITQNDTTDVEQHFAALASSRSDEVPYVRGKYLFSQGKHDEALTAFAAVPRDSELDFPARYYMATAHVAKKDLAKATEIYSDLVARKPRSSNDRRIVELSQLALGRVYYELDQPAKSIDAYLLVDRRSDLFPDALYEVAWVYVKSKQYDKALRALELLHLSEPNSPKSATVRILEGNLRIRKAQMLRQAIISGTLEKNPADPAVEYEKARVVFGETHDHYMPSYLAVSQMVDDADGDPGQYLAQLAGRSGGVFMTAAPLPEAAAQYLREEPDVQRAVDVEMDLGEIKLHLEQSESTIARLEAVLAANDKTAVYPALQVRRARIGEIQDELIKMRAELADRMAGGGGDAPETANRRALVAQYLATPSAEKAFSAQVEGVAREAEAVDAATADVTAALGSTQAIAVALRKYSRDMAVAGTPVPADQHKSVQETLASAGQEAAAIEAELAQIRRELTLARDLAGVGNAEVAKARELRRRVREVQDAELRALAGRGGKEAALADRATRLVAQLAEIETRIDALVATGIEQAKGVIEEERAKIVQYKAELDTLQAESTSLGGTVLGASFKGVKARFYDIVIRTDVGTVDVSWAQKEDADDDLKRLNLSRQRELKQLRDEFRGIIDGFNTPGTAPAAPAPEGGAGGAGGAGGSGGANGGTGGDAGGAPNGSPDRGAGGSRVTPGSDKPATPAAPVVKPDNETQQPSGAKSPQTAPKGGSR